MRWWLHSPAEVAPSLNRHPSPLSTYSIRCVTELVAAAQVHFRRLSGSFVCHDDQIDLTGVRLRNGETSLGASGTVDFARNAVLHLQWMPRAKNQVRVGADPSADVESYLLRGPLFAPRIERAETTPSE